MVPPKHLDHLPRPPLFKALYTFLTRPILEACEMMYWPLLFKHGALTTWFLGDWWVVISDPEQIRALLMDQSLADKKLYTELSPLALVGEYIGVNVLYSKGEAWRRHRKVIGPVFHRDWDPLLFGKWAQVAVDEIELQGGRAVDIHPLMSGMTLDALGEAVMGFIFDATRNPEGEYTSAYHRAAAAVSNNIYFIFPFLESWPIPCRIQGRLAVRHFRDLTRRILKEKQEEIDSKKRDLLSMMLQANLDSQLLNDDELINNTIIMFAAGHDTTANTLSFTLYHLANDQLIQEKARSHVFETLGLADPPKTALIPTKEQASQMVYLDAVNLECMRLSPSLPQMRRCLKKPHALPDGTILPENTLILLQTFAAMNDPKYWDEPTLFNPNRFLKGGSLDRETQRNFFGFGDGTRSCIGYQMSLMEQKVTLSTLLQKFKLSLPHDSIHKHRLVTTQDQLCRPVHLNIIFTPL